MDGACKDRVHVKTREYKPSAKCSLSNENDTWPEALRVTGVITDPLKRPKSGVFVSSSS